MVLKRIMCTSLSVFIYIINRVKYLNKNTIKVSDKQAMLIIGCIKGNRNTYHVGVCF